MWDDITGFGSVIRTCLDRYNTAFWCHMHSVQKHVASTHTPSSLCSLGILLSLFFFPSCSLFLFFFRSISFVRSFFLSLFFFSSSFFKISHSCYCSTPHTHPTPTQYRHKLLVSGWLSVTAGLLMFSMSHMLSWSIRLTQSAKRQNHSFPIQIRGRAYSLYAVQNHLSC